MCDLISKGTNNNCNIFQKCYSIFMKISQNYALLAESVIRDETKKVSLINIFDRIYAEDTPFSQGKIQIFFNLNVQNIDKNSVKLNLSVVSPDSKEILKGEIVVDTSDRSVRHIQIVSDIGGIILPEFGDYKLILSDSKEKIAEKILSVEKASKEEIKKYVG